jgi:hypothetical protein
MKNEGLRSLVTRDGLNKRDDPPFNFGIFDAQP